MNTDRETYAPAGLDPHSKKKRELTEQQQALLDCVFDFQGDAVRAAVHVGYANPHSAVRTLAPHLVELAENYMARTALKAAMKIGDVIDSDIPVPQASEKLKACQLILDRTNPKVDKVDISGEVSGGIFILPNKVASDEGE